jgi:hypothetical protein
LQSTANSSPQKSLFYRVITGNFAISLCFLVNN